MFDESMIEFLQSGCSWVVATLDSEGRPHAGRGWGVTVLDPVNGRVRLVADADPVTVAHLRPGAAIALTGAVVSTLRSTQLKGHVVHVEAMTATDEARRVQHTTALLTEIHNFDGDPIEMLQRWATRPLVACEIDVESSFDQTPGPSAGTPLGATPR
ncbi:MAG TPA: hypothetical protein VH761_04470 [Ilumatobacteraceae bacterium]